MDKISFWFPVLYQGLLKHSVLKTQYKICNTLLIGDINFDLVDPSDISKLVHGSITLKSIDKSDYLVVSDEERFKRVKALGIGKITTATSAFHHFLKDHTDIDLYDLRELEEIIDSTTDASVSVLQYVAKLIEISAKSDYAVDKSRIAEVEENEEELNNLYKERGIPNYFELAEKRNLAGLKKSPTFYIEIPGDVDLDYFGELRGVWDRINDKLAENPKYFSAQTLDILTKMTAEDMLSFRNLCRLLLEDQFGNKFLWYPLNISSFGLITYYDNDGREPFTKVRELGLLGSKDRMFVSGSPNQPFVMSNRRDTVLCLYPRMDKDIRDTINDLDSFYIYPLTQAGEQLLALADVKPSKYFILRLGTDFRQFCEKLYVCSAYRITEEKDRWSHEWTYDKSHDLLADWKEKIDNAEPIVKQDSLDSITTSDLTEEQQKLIDERIRPDI